MGIVPNVLVMDFINYVTDHVSFRALVARKLKAKFAANLQKAFRISPLLLLFFPTLPCGVIFIFSPALL